MKPLQRLITTLILLHATVSLAVAQTTWNDYETRKHWTGLLAHDDAANAGVTIDDVLAWLQLRNDIRASVLAQEPDVSTPDYVADSARICTELAKQALADSFVASPCPTMRATSILFDLTCGTPEQLRKVDIEQYLAARSEASEREISMSALLLERIQQDRACRAVDRAALEIELAAQEKERQRKETIETIVNVSAGILMLLTIVLAIRSVKLNTNGFTADSSVSEMPLPETRYAKVVDFLFAANAPKGWRRVTIVAILISAILWAIIVLQDAGGLMRVGVSEWVAFFAVSALIVVIPLSLLASYFYLPKLGTHRGWELALFLEAPMLIAAVVIYNAIAWGSPAIDGEFVLEFLTVALLAGLGMVLVTKLIAWIVVGFRSE